MLLIADSGSTKTDWRLVNNNEILSFNTIGLNPYHIDHNRVEQELSNSELDAIKSKVTHVVFYGAGCSSPEKCKLIHQPLSNFFSNAKVEVEHDMLAAVRSTCGKDSGMVAILGTGSNSCVYDGKNITENVTALGYILGDFGGGVDIGKTFIQAFLAKELPQEISEAFDKSYNLSVTAILDAVYSQPLPNRFLASFNQFVYQHINHPEMKQLVQNSFSRFFKVNICKYKDYQNQPLHLIGSIAYLYKDLLAETAKEHQIQLGRIVKQPIEELVKYHQSIK